MKKIGLAVCYDTKNFGSQLQVLATIKKIEELGYDTEIIRYKKTLTPTFIVQTIPRLFNVDFISNKLRAMKKKKSIEKYSDIAKNILVRNKRFDDFVKRYFTKISHPYKGWERLVKESAENYDGFLCGSDQLWLPMNLGSHFYTLEFAPENKPKIAYATSFGVSSIPKNQKKATTKYLNRFSALSNREISGSKIVEELTGMPSQVVCDPTLLLSGAEWFEVIPNRKVIEEPYIFCYFLGTNEEHRKMAKEVHGKTGLKIVTCPFLDNFVETDMNFGDIQLFDMDAEDFVNLIRHAEYICTDSFHGSVFSILNHKKFVTFSRFSDESKGSRNSRIDSLFELTGLKDRHCKGDVVNNVMKDIDYNAVDEKLCILRKESIEFLDNALKQC